VGRPPSRRRTRARPIVAAEVVAEQDQPVNDETVRQPANAHVDVKKGGNIPDGGGWRYVGRPQGRKNRAATPGKAKNKWRGPKMGYAFVHTVIDDHSRVAYAEIHDDETATGVLHRAVEWFSDRGVTVERVLSDNGSAYRSHLWRDTCEALAIKPKRTRRTVRRPTARSSGSTAPWPTDGSTPAAIGPSTSVERHSLPGSITTTTIGRTPPAPTSRPSRD
jgi:transposase InsO family protein